MFGHAESISFFSLVIFPDQSQVSGMGIRLGRESSLCYELVTDSSSATEHVLSSPCILISVTTCYNSPAFPF